MLDRVSDTVGYRGAGESPKRLWFPKPVLVLSYHFNRLDFLGLQWMALNAFLEDDFQFVVFNDAGWRGTAMTFGERGMVWRIEDFCKSRDIVSVRVPQEIHERPYLYRHPGESFDHPCARAANVIQWSLDHYGLWHHGLVCVMHSDIFPVDRFCVSEYMRGFDLGFTRQSRSHGVEYMWDGLVFLNVPSLPDRDRLNFNCGIVEDQACDVGGYTFHYLEGHPELRVRGGAQLSCASWEPEDLDTMKGMDSELREYLKVDYHLSGRKCDLFLEGFKFLHHRGGANWDHGGSDLHRRRGELLTEFVGSAIERKGIRK